VTWKSYKYINFIYWAFFFSSKWYDFQCEWVEVEQLLDIALQWMPVVLSSWSISVWVVENATCMIKHLRLGQHGT
jgi:hypothetical protein